MKDNVAARQESFNNLIALKYSDEELKAKFSNIQNIITLIGENDNYTRLLASFEGVDDNDDPSISNARELRANFVKQLTEQLAEFGINLQPTYSDKKMDKKRILPVAA